MKVKYKDIAQTLGISTTAVSLALNNRPGVSEETRQKVFELYKSKLDHVYINAPAEADANESSPIIFATHYNQKMIINDKPFFNNLISSIQQECMKKKYPLRIMNYYPTQNLDEYIHSLNCTDCSGIIVLATEIDNSSITAYRKLHKPFLLLDSAFDFEEFNCIELSNQTSILQAMKYAYDFGHRNIGYLKSSIGINNFDHRFNGYENGLRIFGIQENNNPVIPLHCSMEQAYLDMKHFLQNQPEGFLFPTIFLSDLDYIAIGAMRALTEYGIKVPEEISLIGFDDVPLCELVLPQLTTVRVNHCDIGRLAFERLLQLIEHEDDFYTITQISSEIVTRQSVRDLNT